MYHIYMKVGFIFLFNVGGKNLLKYGWGHVAVVALASALTWGRLKSGRGSIREYSVCVGEDRAWMRLHDLE